LRSLLSILFLLILSCSCKQGTGSKNNGLDKNLVDCANRKTLTGNKVFQKEPYSDNYYIDPIDDTLDYRYFAKGIYIRNDGKVFQKSISGNNIECKIFYEFFKDVSDFIDTNSYKVIDKDYFSNKGKVYMWWGNSDGSYPCEVEGADAITFKPFDEVCGGIDKSSVFYGSPTDEIRKIVGANPASIKVLNKRSGCWNCGDCYFADEQNIFFANASIPGCDVTTFQLIDSDSVDAKDKKRRYLNGKVVGEVSGYK
jgi:hypothetical protein